MSRLPLTGKREHAPDDVKYLWHSCFEDNDGQLLGRLSRFQVRNGYPLAGEDIDPLGHDALAALEEVMNTPEMALSFDIQPGQIQLVNNSLLGAPAYRIYRLAGCHKEAIAGEAVAAGLGAALLQWVDGRDPPRALPT